MYETVYTLNDNQIQDEQESQVQSIQHRKEPMTDNKRSNIYMMPIEMLQEAHPAATQFKNYPDVLTVHQTAELMGVCRNTVYKLLKENQLSCRRIGTAIRIRKKDVQLFLRKAI